MSGAYIEHSEVIINFVAIVYNQLKDNICRVYPDNVQYKWTVGTETKTVIPDASINCRVHAKKGNSFYDIPRFVMEVLSPSTENTTGKTKKSFIDNRKLTNTGLSIGEKGKSKSIR